MEGGLTGASGVHVRQVVAHQNKTDKDIAQNLPQFMEEIVQDQMWKSKSVIYRNAVVYCVV